MSWRSLLVGDDATTALAVVEAIAAGLQTAPPSARGGPSVSHGRAGAAVLYSYLDRVCPDRGYQALAVAELDAAIGDLASIAYSPALHGGFMGLGWAIDHLRDHVPELDIDTNTGLDEGVFAWLERDVWTDDYDLISGLVGAGVYAIERLPHANGAELLRRVVARLAALAEPHAGGIAWRTRPDRLARAQRARYPAGSFNLGLAHGVPGVIALLGQARRAGVAPATVDSLLDGSVLWLIARQQPLDARSAFARWIGPELDETPSYSRLAWCYGDPGVAVALMAASRSLGCSAWADHALAIARRAAARGLEGSSVVDAGLCHGAAGVAHIFNRLFQATSDPTLGDAAHAWFRRAIQMRRPGEGIAGFPSWGPPPGTDEDAERPPQSWLVDAGLLTGETGVALALLGAVSTVAPDWDRLLLTSIAATPSTVG